MQGQANKCFKSMWLLGLMAMGAPLAAQESPASAPDTTPAISVSTSESRGPKSLLPDDLMAPASAPVVTAPLLPPRSVQPVESGDQTERPAGEEHGESLADLTPKEVKDPWADLVGPVVSAARAGLLGEKTNGLAADIFAESDGRMLAVLAERIEAPLASRWAQILVQRALVSRARPPQHIEAADWLAARTSALVALGLAADAHRMMSQISTSEYTPDAHTSAAAAALASADPLGLCPLAPAARREAASPTWLMVSALCYSASGEEYQASVMFDQLRRNKDLEPLDIGLAEQISSILGGGRRGAHPEWEGIKGLNAWRIGLGAAAGAELPKNLLETLTPGQIGWMVRLPEVALKIRADLAPLAAAHGTISSAEARRILAAETTGLTGKEASESAGRLLRTASNAANQSDRRDALKSLFGRVKAGSNLRYGYQLAAANAAAGIVPDGEAGDLAPAIVESLLGAGLTSEALRWWQVAPALEPASRAKLWALLAPLGGGVPAETSDYKEWTKKVSPHRAQLVAAGLAGLGRGQFDSKLEALTNPWTEALDRARDAGRAGEALLIIASGLHGRWADLHPDYLRRMVEALTVLGFETEARLMVAEAATRG